MWRFRICLLTLLCAGTIGVLFTPAGQPSQPPSAAPKPLPEPKADWSATRAFDDALKVLESKSQVFVETTLWQQMEMQGFMLQSQGTYIVGPDQHLRMDLSVNVGDTVGRMEVVCDGTTYWQALQVGDKDPKLIQKIDWKRVQEALRKPDVPPLVRDEFLQLRSFNGVAPLLQGLKQNMTFTKRELVRWNDRDVIKLTADWTNDSVKKMLGTIEMPNWPPFLPRECRIFFDEKNSWPYRLEWWGPTPPLSKDTLMLQMEFRNPRHFSMTPERAAKVFRFDAGNNPSADRTQETIQEIEETARRVRTMKKGR